MVQTPPRFCWPIYGSHNGSITTDGLPGILDCMDWLFLFQFLSTPDTTTGMSPRTIVDEEKVLLGSQSHPATWVTSPDPKVKEVAHTP